MRQPLGNDLDFLSARLHGRRSRLAEAERLDTLSGIRDLPEFFHAVYPEAKLPTATEFQRRLVRELIDEISAFLTHLSGTEARLLEWILVRFQVENLKVVLRGRSTGKPIEEHLMPLYGTQAIDVQALTAAASLEEFATLIPQEAIGKKFLQLAAPLGDQSPPLFLEAALDSAYFAQLIAKVHAISGEDTATIKALIFNEADMFHLMLAVRGRFHYGLTPELLLPLHVDGTRIPRMRFAAMLADPDLSTVANRAVGRVLDMLPRAADPVNIEVLAKDRFWRLANKAFRNSAIGFGVVIGYVGIRRVDVANLITLSEAIRAGMAPASVRARLIPRSGKEAAYV